MLKPLLACLLLSAPLTARAVDDADAVQPAPGTIEAPATSTEPAHGSDEAASGTATSDARTTEGAEPSPVAPQAPLSIAPQGGIGGSPKAPVGRASASAAAAPQGGGGAIAAPVEPATHNCIMPKRKATAEMVLARPGMADALTRLCRNKTDWTYLDAVVDELRKTDRRWGYWCRRGRCGDPSHDILAYYCGPGLPYEGADNATGVDFVVASCYDPGDGATPSIGWGVFEKGNPVGSNGWTSRGRFRP